MIPGIASIKAVMISPMPARRVVIIVGRAARSDETISGIAAMICSIAPTITSITEGRAAVAALMRSGIAATIAHEDGWLDSMCMLVALLLAGRLLEARGRRRTAEAAATLSAVTPREARVVRGDAVVTVDQKKMPSHDLFHELGVFEFPSGASATVTLSNEGSDGFVVVDAVQWVPVE